MKGINLKEVCRQIKFHGKRSLIWSRTDEFHYITNRHWMLRFSDSHLPREVLVLLFSVFAMIPEPRKALVANFGDVTEKEAINIQPIYTSLGTAKPGNITPFSKDHDVLRMRIIQSGSDFIYLDEEYVKMVDLNEEAACTGKVSSVFFLNGAVVILPYRNTSGNEILLADLIADQVSR
ncbi:hypothetical protein DFQ01_121104 [Paenibacillus cellulosilyticus]|uniref:Uncharacterized protein n=1 Tax=Paenibacillus cellulosilyticus TaxID=375489 RepID=A0A2V2YNR8_9BACL|nr:hypothetical protein [Paenibacillus cellulosilyticus]PWV97460.1 hypothetical protein DFQ01_121104 [Paenibacillus cellulosilyticus]QKS48503.1 hypothetical protein HUB94_30170 [Paenibacillus cellulosilyticus]